MAADQAVNKQTFIAEGRATLIGSLPLTDHREALDWIFNHTPDIPLWPQLPHFPPEGMLNQFIEGFPGIIETEDRTFFHVTSGDFEAQMLSFFEEYLAAGEDPDSPVSARFQISRERAPGLYLLPEEAKKRNNSTALKGQITGPFTLLTGINDQDHRLGYYNPNVREIIVKGLAMKAVWQVQFLKTAGLPVLLFIDEPALAGLGSSSFISISTEDISNDLAEIVNAIHWAGGIAGVHVCANTDWELLLSLEIDILSFDAYSFFERFITCKERIHAFLERGGTIAWGLVPTADNETIGNETLGSLLTLWRNKAAQLAEGKWNLSSLLKQGLITPSCGTGSLTPEAARRVLKLTRGLSDALRDEYL